MNKRIFSLLFLVLVSVSSFSFNQRLDDDPPIIVPPIKTSIIHIVQDDMNTDGVSKIVNQSVSVLHL